LFGIILRTDYYVNQHKASAHYINISIAIQQHQYRLPLEPSLCQAENGKEAPVNFIGAPGL